MSRDFDQSELFKKVEKYTTVGNHVNVLPPESAMETAPAPHDFLDLRRTVPLEQQPVVQRQPNLITSLKGTGTAKAVCLSNQLGRSTKAFQEEELQPLPQRPVEAEDFTWSKSKPGSSFKHPAQESLKQGEIIPGSKSMLHELTQKSKNLTATTGVIITQCMKPEFGEYTQDIHYVSDEVLGQGTFGKVELCFDSATKMKFVKKEILIEHFAESEVTVPISLSHRNITEVYGVVYRANPTGNSRMELLMEYGGVALNKFISNGSLNSDAQILSLIKSGLDAFAYLQLYQIIHKDVKPENLLVQTEVDGSLTLKLADFGSCQPPQEKLQLIGLTPEYLAPELAKIVLQMRRHGPDGVPTSHIDGKVDVFSFGLVIMYMYMRYHILQKLITGGRESYANFTEDQKTAFQFKLLIWLASEPDLKAMIPDKCDLDMRELLQAMLEVDPAKRCSARQALQMIKCVEAKQSAISQPKPVDKKQNMMDFNISIEEIDLAMTSGDIPDIAANTMETDSGPAKMTTLAKLRNKVHPKKMVPYSKKGKGGGKLQNPWIASGRRLASKEMLAPMSPQQEMMQIRANIQISGVSERKSPIGQPTSDDTPQLHTGQARGQAVPVQQHFQMTGNFDIDLPAPVPVITQPRQLVEQQAVRPDQSQLTQEQQDLFRMIQQLQRQNRLTPEMIQLIQGSAQAPAQVQAPEAAAPAKAVPVVEMTEAQSPDSEVEMETDIDLNLPNFDQLE